MGQCSSNIAADLFRAEGARLVVTLTAFLGTHRIELAEDLVQEALVRALQTWPYRGVPENPAAWLTQTAKNLAIDHLRREQRWNRKQEGIAAEHQRWFSNPMEDANSDTIVDDTLRMMFVCFHPLLSIEAQTALALRTLCGFSAAEIGAAFFSTEAAINKRLVRTRQRIRDLDLPFAIPNLAELPKRLDGVLHTLYLLFNEGYKASSGDRLVREELCREAIRLTELLAARPETTGQCVHALLALMELNAARLSGRTDDAGNIWRLHEQDRTTWDSALIRRGIVHLGLAATGNCVSEYHLEAGIAACHSIAADEGSTDWPRILTLYDLLLGKNSSPIVAMNRAVAVARVHGAQAGLDALAAIRPRNAIESLHLYHAICGSFTAELGRHTEALTHFRQAENRVILSAERDFIRCRIAELTLLPATQD